MVTLDLFLAQAQEAGGIVVENVALLYGREERRLFDRLSRRFDNAWPDHLVRAEHDAIAIASLEELLQPAIERRPRLGVDDASNIV